MLQLLTLLFALVLLPQGPSQSCSQALPSPSARELDLPLERFDVFFERFKSSRHFQRKRTIFPLDQVTADSEELQSTVVDVEKSDWELLRFDSKGVLVPAGGEIVKQTIHDEGPIVRLEVRGTVRNLAVDYKFERRVGKWHLVEVVTYVN